jgi:hypothetical protein
MSAMINHGRDFAKLELILPITGDLNLVAKDILEAYTNNKTTDEIVSRILVGSFGYNGKKSRKQYKVAASELLPPVLGKTLFFFILV